MSARVYRAVSSAMAATAWMLAAALTPATASDQLELKLIGNYQTGVFDEGAAEIVAYDAASERLFHVNANAATVDALSLADPAQPVKLFSIDVTAHGAGVNSVAVHDGIVAVAVEAATVGTAGKVVFYDTDGTFLNSVTAGALPDMVTFTPDGTKVLVANEGEPNDAYTVDPAGSVTIVDLSGGVASATATQVSFSAWDGQEASLRAQGVRIFGPNASASQDFEPEYIAVSADGSTAWVALQENNAFVIIDVPSATATSIVPLGYKDHSIAGQGLDASNRDDAINITTWPVWGMFMPDAIDAYEVDGQTYIITANEGDSRDYGGYSEEERVKDLTLDPIRYPDAATLQLDENLGRLKTTSANGDTDGDGDVDQIYSYGARSLSIWDANGRLVWDSGDEFEQQLARLVPDHFNSTNDESGTFDDRSDDKGAEPEAVEIAWIGDRAYAFIGLERLGGVMVYDVTNPRAGRFLTYVNNRDFDVTIDPDAVTAADLAAAGDLGPECVLFIAADDSPTGDDLLVVSNEITGSISVYEVATRMGFVRSPTVLETYTFDNLPVLGTTAAGEEILLGGFSGLYFEGVNPANGNLQFITHPDRGPNGDPGDFDGDGVNERPFPLPDFQSQWVRFEVDESAGTVAVTEIVPLTRNGTTPITGLPNLEGTGGFAYADEIPVDLFGNPLSRDPFGADMEGIVQDEDGTYWMCDEYRPALYHFDETGDLIARYVPEGSSDEVNVGIEAFPAVFAQRRANRGFEALAIQDGNIFAFIQSPIDNPDTSNDASSKASRWGRILEFNPRTQTTIAEYLYEFELGGSDKIGDAVSVGDGKFLVIERDSGTGETSKKVVFEIDITRASNVTGMDEVFEGMTRADLRSLHLRTVSKRVVVDLAEAGYHFTDKPEGLAWIDEQTIAVLNDNDFQLAGGFNSTTGLLDVNPNPHPVVLGIIHLNSLRPSKGATALSATVTASGIPMSGVTVELSRAVSGRARDFAWDEVTDVDGVAVLRIAGTRVGGYYEAQAKDASGAVIGRWGNIPLNAGWMANVILPMGGSALVMSQEPLPSAKTLAAPSEATLNGNFPNPFNPETQIRYQLAQPAQVRVAIYNALGQHVRTLLDATQMPGTHELTWDGRDVAGRHAASGVYFYRLELVEQGIVQTRAMSLIR